MPINTWNYKSEDPSIRHMGPMAQDLHAAFGLGDSDKAITTIDADGVALAAIKGLYDQLKEREGEIAAQKRELTELKVRLAALEAALQKTGD
jgi:hypothetical protein